MEINTKNLLCQTVCKYCYRVLLRANVEAVVMWKLALKMFVPNSVLILLTGVS